MCRVGRSVEPRADARCRYYQRTRSARDSGAEYCSAAWDSAWRERAADARGHARCHGDERRDARHDTRPVGSTAPGDAAHSFVLRRWPDATPAGERQGPRDALRARARRNCQISARPPDVRPQFSTRSGHRRVYARDGRAIPRRDSAGRNASRRNGTAAAAAGTEPGAR